MGSEKHFEKTFISHGGIGVVTDKISVSLRQPTNTLFLSSGKWQGADSAQTQVIVTDGRQILPENTTHDCHTLCVIIFCPTEVHFIDYASGTVGKYKRQTEFFNQSHR